MGVLSSCPPYVISFDAVVHINIGHACQFVINTILVSNICVCSAIIAIAPNIALKAVLIACILFQSSFVSFIAYFLMLVCLILFLCLIVSYF